MNEVISRFCKHEANICKEGRNRVLNYPEKEINFPFKIKAKFEAKLLLPSSSSFIFQY